MEPIEDEEELIAKHRKEKKELQAEVQKLKKGISKGDKKRKKEVTEEIAKLEADLNAKQESELASLKSNQTTDKPEAITDSATPTAVDQIEEEEEEAETSNENTTKKSKAQRRRDKKTTKGKEREHRIQKQEIVNRQGPRQVEMMAVAKMLLERGLALQEIAADGDCLYNAVSHQLSLRDMELPCGKLREKAANFMRQHPDDFIPFLVHPDTDNIMTPEQFSAYCDKTEKLPVWGGQIELRALSEVLDLPIEVLQANVKPLVIGDTKDAQAITLVYHLHAYRLGEHYNSVRLRKPEDDDDEDESIDEPQE